MKCKDIHIKDIVAFKTRLLNKKVEDIGVVKGKSFDEYWDEWYVDVIPFNLKVSSLLLKPRRVKSVIGRYSNFDFTNDESNHDFKLGYKFKLRLSDDFFKRYIEEIGYAYWSTAEEMKISFKDHNEIDCLIDEYQGSHMYHIFTKIHDLRLNDNFIKEFNI